MGPGPQEHSLEPHHGTRGGTLPQLEKNQGILPQRELRHFSAEASRRNPLFRHEPQRVLDPLEKLKNFPRHPCLPSRGTPRSPPQLKKSPGSPFSFREEGPFPASSERESRRSHPPQEEVVSMMLENNSRVVPPFQARKPHCTPDRT